MCANDLIRYNIIICAVVFGGDDSFLKINLNVKRHFLSGANGRLISVAFESNGILYSQAAGC